MAVADPAGDAKGSQAATDITKVLFTTSGKTTTKRVGNKNVKIYTANALIVQLVLAAPPTAAPPVVYEVDSQTQKCGTMYLYYDPEELASGGFLGGCSPADATGSTTTDIDVIPVVKGSTITWTMPLSGLPKDMKIGSTITDVQSYVAVADPFTGASTALLTTAANFDTAESSSVYKIG